MELNCGIGKSVYCIKDLVSVIIPTKNSAKTLHYAIQGIQSQTYKHLEIIVVDNFSTDNTRDIANRYNVKVFTKGNERANQIDYGIKKAFGEYIYLTGSDMISDPTYIEDAVLKCKEGYDAIYASVVSKYHDNYWSRVKALERQIYIGTNTELSRFFKREVFYKIGGIDINLISMEEDLQHRINKAGLKTGRISTRETHLHEATSLHEVAQKSYYYGMYIKTYLKKYPVKGTKFLFPLRMAYIKNFWCLITNPFLSCGLIVYKIVQYYNGIRGMMSKEDKDNLNKRIYEKHSVNHPTT
jgi:glycosyltransferase involved in cell wall biosynthesis